MNDADMRSAGRTSAGMTGTAPAGASISYGTDPGDPSRADIVGGVGERLSDDEVTAFVTRALARADLDDKRVCLVVPDGTRSCPLPLLMRSASRPRRPSEPGNGRDRTRHPARNERGTPGSSPRLFGAGQETDPGWKIINHDPGCRRPLSRWAPSARRDERADRRADARHLRGRADQPARRRARRGDRCRTGVSHEVVGSPAATSTSFPGCPARS